MVRAWLFASLFVTSVLGTLVVGCLKESVNPNGPEEREADSGNVSTGQKARPVVSPPRDGSVDSTEASTPSLWDESNDYLLEVGDIGPKRSPCSEGEFSVFYEPRSHRVAVLVCEKVDGEWIVVDRDGPTEASEDSNLALVLEATKVSPKLRCDASKADAVLTVRGGDAGTRSYGDAVGRCNVPGVSLYLANMDGVVASFRALTLAAP